MTVITKPLSQERKDEKPEKEVVNVSENPTNLPCDETVVVSSDSRSICVEIAGHTHVRRRSRSSNSPSRTLFVTKICLLIPALCSIIMGFSIAMHGILTIVPNRQMYKGLCRIPYPSTIFPELSRQLEPTYLDWKFTRENIGSDGPGPKSFGFAARLEGNENGNSIVGNKKYFSLVTGDFENGPNPESKPKVAKEKKMRQLMERMVQMALYHKKGNLQTSGNSKTIPHPTVESGTYTPPPTKSGNHDEKAKNEKEFDKGEKVVDRNFELDFDIDIDSEREELQMPELSKGKYLHDFKMNKTAIIDHGKKRCFVFELNRKHIASPRSLYELLHGMMKGSFGINLQQIRQDMALTFPAVNNFEEYGRVIKNACDGMKTYRLVPSTSIEMKTPKGLHQEGDVDITNERVKKIGSRTRRSTKAEGTQAEDNYLEFAGKYIHYNIVNLEEIQ